MHYDNALQMPDVIANAILYDESSCRQSLEQVLSKILGLKR